MIRNLNQLLKISFGQVPINIQIRTIETKHRINQPQRLIVPDLLLNYIYSCANFYYQQLSTSKSEKVSQEFNLFPRKLGDFHNSFYV